MSKPLTMAPERERVIRTFDAIITDDDTNSIAQDRRLLLAEVDALRAALAAAEAKLADERRHADELAQGLRELSGPCEYPDNCARHQHHRCRSCSEAKLIAPLLAAHATRRAAEAR